MDTLRRHYFPIYIGYVLISGLLISLALLCYPEGRTLSFWTRLGVMEVALLVAILGVNLVVSATEPDKFSYRNGGPLVGLLKGLLYYLIVTISLFVAGTVGDCVLSLDLGKYVKLVQPLLSVAFVLYALWIQWTRSSKDSAEDALATQGDGPRNLAALIRSTARRIKQNKTTKPLILRMDGLREDFQFRLPMAGKVLVHPKYKELVVKVRRLMSEITEDPNEAMCADWIRKLEDYRTEAEVIRGEVKR